MDGAVDAEPVAPTGPQGDPSAARRVLKPLPQEPFFPESAAACRPFLGFWVPHKDSTTLGGHWFKPNRDRYPFVRPNRLLTAILLET